jgi:hypothetical protein
MKHHRPAKSRVQIVRVSAILAVIVALAAGILGWYSQFAGRSGGGRASTTPGSSSPVRLNDSTPAGGRRLAFRPYDHTDASGFQVILPLALATFRRDMLSLAATGTATETSTCSSRLAEP